MRLWNLERMFVTAGVALPVASVLGPMDAATGP